MFLILTRKEHANGAAVFGADYEFAKVPVSKLAHPMRKTPQLRWLCAGTETKDTFESELRMAHSG